MPSKARLAFNESESDIRRLLEIHGSLGGPAKGRRFKLEVLNKSAIVLITAIWEAYCEDLVAEAVRHIVQYARTGDALPLELRKKIAKELKGIPHELEIWKLADRGWKKVVTSRLASQMEERNRKLNTPKAQHIAELFSTALGLEDITRRWYWKRMSVGQAKAKLDKYIELRGAIAHRGKAAASCTKANVTQYLAHVKRLVGLTGGGVNGHVKKVTGRSLW
jgi:hypothetical protein